MINEAMRQHLNAQLFDAAEDTAYAIIDGAASPGLLTQLKASNEQHRCLYRGEHSAGLQAAAPYLVKLTRYSHLGEWLHNRWGQHPCIYATIPSPIEFETVYKHFRSLFIITNSDNNKSLYFRYYDPRTLRRFLNHCTASQARKVFGPVQFYLLENPQKEPQKSTIQSYWEEETGIKHAALISAQPEPTTASSSEPFGDTEITLSAEELAWRTQHKQTQQRLAQRAEAKGTSKGLLIISPAQMQQQYLSDETDFIQWYSDDYLPEYLPDIAQAFPPEKLKEMVKYGRNQAIQQGFNDPANQVQFVTLMWQLGPDFYDFPGFKEIINADQTTETERIDKLYQVNSTQWDNAMQNSHPHYWFQEDSP